MFLENFKKETKNIKNNTTLNVLLLFIKSISVINHRES